MKNSEDTNLSILDCTVPKRRLIDYSRVIRDEDRQRVTIK